MDSPCYIAIDMKSFYASVECVDRGLNPLVTNLVVADSSRTDKTICLAVSPTLKALGVPGRPRLFEVNRIIKDVNSRRRAALGRRFTGKSSDATFLSSHPDYEIDFVVATPRMAHYIDVSCDVYETYLHYVSSEDIHVYSIDEVFIDCTQYLSVYGISAHELAMRMIRDVLRRTGITATAGIGTNMYLCKVAMDIVAKHKEADSDGVRIAELDEMSYRRLLWDHKPLKDFWRVGHGIADKLALYGLDTMGKIARASLVNEDFFYSLFGVNAELLLDHAWGYEPCTMPLVRAYRPDSKSLGQGQVLQSPYDYDKAKVVVKEMADTLSLDLLSKGKVTSQIVLFIGYDRESPTAASGARGTANLQSPTNLSSKIVEAAVSIFENSVGRNALVRRVYVTANGVVDEASLADEEPLQLDLFESYEDAIKRKQEQKALGEKEKSLQKARLSISSRFGKNALLRGLDFEEGATTRQRNNQIGGHKA